MLNLDPTVSPTLMRIASFWLSAGVGAWVGVGVAVNWGVSVGPDAVVALAGFSVVGGSSVSVTAQAGTTKTPIAKMPTINTARNLGIDN